MSSMIGNKIKLSIFGQSHGRAIGVVIDGLPAGEAIDFTQIAKFMARRAGGNSVIATARSEADLPEILSGIVDGKTCGAPLCAVIANTDVRSEDYEKIRNIPRPSHADYTAFLKYGESRDVAGGGHFSGRLTAPLCFAGAVLAQILARRGVFCGAHVASVGLVHDERWDMVTVDKSQLLAPGEKQFPAISDNSAIGMTEEITHAKASGNSVGGTIECAAIGVPGGLGDPMFDGVENLISKAVFGIPAVRGIEFGAGFDAAQMSGFEHNDEFCVNEHGEIFTKTNNHGGILGGITSGMPIVLRVAIKPTPSIDFPQKSVNLTTREPAEISTRGRHDPCIVPRAVPCVESAVLAVLADLIL